MTRIIIAIALCLSPAIASASAYSDAVEGEGTLLHYWKMDEAAGPTLAATTGGTALTLSGGTPAQAGLVGDAVYFDGINDEASSAATLDFTANNRLVIEFLWKTTAYDGTDRCTVELGAGILAAGTVFFTQDNSGISQSAAFISGDVGYSYATFTRPSTGAWHHVVVDADMSQATDEADLWIDGALVTPAARPINANNTSTFSNALFHVMHRTGGSGSMFAEGWMQHLAIYSGLTGARIAAHYAAAVAPTITYTVLAADLWDNGRDNVVTPRQTTFSRFVFSTNAATVDVAGTTDIYTDFPAWAHLYARINGVRQPALAFTANGADTFTLTLGAAGTTREVELVSGLESDVSGVKGTYIDSVTYADDGSTFNVYAPVTSNRVLVYGDSISVGDYSSDPGFESYAAILRNTYGVRTMVEGWGVRSLHTDAVDAPTRAAFVSRVAGYNAQVMWIAIGTNDYGLSRWTAANFGTAYANTLDDIHTAAPSMRLVCQTPLVRTSEVANGFGDILQDYRDQINTVCGARPWTRLVDGTEIMTTASLQDGIHPTEAGHILYAAYIAGRVNLRTAPLRMGNRVRPSIRVR